MFRKIWNIYRLPIILGIVSLVFILFSITIFIKSYQAAAPVEFSFDAEAASAAGEKAPGIMVDIEGAVGKPGVYVMPAGSRVEDVIAKAGGFISTADTEVIAKTVNRAAKLTDGAKLFIPEIGTGVDVSLSNSPSSALININTASEQELDRLSGVGPVTAQKIITGRPYMRIEELVEKKAISQSLFAKLKDQLAL